MMQFYDERETFAVCIVGELESVDKSDVPQWAIPFERFFENSRGQSHQAIDFAVVAEVHISQVPLDTEVWIVNPVGTPQPQGYFLQALAEEGDHMKPASQISDKGAEGQGFVALPGIKKIDAANVHGGGFGLQVQE
eukprot:TRINITY_DN3868_c0_g3_i1.p2 TRINITY_DN3868_c0_g3~~TRINITY_DN3868_c0_g3_i1.p2  ORF type:complete len:136 (+),score=6.17 TRINITY_DN3868_c0_g3_i1:230-637(+)